MTRLALRSGLLVLVLTPLAAGLLGVALPALGVLPALSAPTGPAPFIAFLAEPHVGASLRISLWTGGAATLLSLAATLILAGGLEAKGALTPPKLVMLALPLLLAVPHLSLALGLASALGPSGWFVRLVSPWATGFERPPNWPEAPYLGGLPLVLGLALKETPFLLLAVAAALPTLSLERQRRVAAALGYGPFEAWWKITVPRLLPHLRLPLLAVLVYGTTNVEMAAVLGPTTPPPLALRLLDGFRDPDLTRRLAASAGTLILAAATALLASPLFWGGPPLANLTRSWRLRGSGSRLGPATPPAAAAAATLLLLLWLLALALLAAWSVAGPWPFPRLVPGGITLRIWTEGARSFAALSVVTALIAVASALLAAGLALWEVETRRPGGRRPLWPYLPLLLPQLGFVPGVAVALLALGLDGGYAGVILLHALLALPYAHLFLAEAHARLDPRYAATARSLGHGRLSVLLRVRLPLLRPALVTALATGFAVSCGLYLPTLLAGSGQIVTLPVEVLALGAGGDRRLAAGLGLVLALLPLSAFTLAAFVRRRAAGRLR